MRGKIVNLCIGSMNILLGILLVVYTKFVPMEITELTLQELSVTSTILRMIYGIIIIVFLIDIFQYQNCKDNSGMKTGYLFGFFTMSFFMIQKPLIASFAILSGLIVVFQTIRDNSVEIDSTAGISVIALMCIGIVGLTGATKFYENIGQYIKNKENEDSLAYKSDYFKYITELDIEDVYINVKKDGKYGYINQNGDVVIDFVYDYASPFVDITVYNKEFQVALVCQEGTSYVILKNERKVMSYRAESADSNYEVKMTELEDIYKNTLGQGGKMETEIAKKTDNMKRAMCYEELSEEYTYRYDYNDEYDIIITKSNLDLGDKFELAKKENLDMRIELECKNLDYDEDYLYLYSNFSIPFFDVESKEQGWFNSYGKKNTMTGKAQILEFIDDKILLKNYNDGTIYFIDSEGKILSDTYKDIFIAGDRYIVKNMSNKYMVIDKEFNKVFEDEFDMIDPYLAEFGLYICANTNEAIDFNDYNFAKMNFKLLNYNGETIMDGIEQIYGNYYQISGDKQIQYVRRYEEFLEKIKDIEFNFVGDKFYKGYID